jgi:putative hydrolase
MIVVDLHSHSLFSGCGVHTVVELLTRARERGLAALAVTDHGPAVGGRLNSVFFERLHEPVPGIRLLKGVESNLGPRPGTTDFPLEYVRHCDVALLGIHSNTPRGLAPEQYTDLLLSALEANLFLDIVTHANSAEYPVASARLARGVRDLGRALELNNSKVALSRVEEGVTEALIRACMSEGCPVVVSSDAHTLDEVGSDAAIRGFMSRLAFPEELVVNRTAESAFAFIEGRRSSKCSAPVQPSDKVAS